MCGLNCVWQGICDKRDVTQGLILGVKTYHLHEWRRTKKSKQRIERTDNSDKTKKNFTGFYTEGNPTQGMNTVNTL